MSRANDRNVHVHVLDGGSRGSVTQPFVNRTNRERREKADARARRVEVNLLRAVAKFKISNVRTGCPFSQFPVLYIL